MQSAFRIGRVGPLTIFLNYNWFLAAIIELWWVGLLWAPANFPARGGLFYWSVALVTLLLYLASVIVHELVRTAIAQTGRRNVNLYPFGAAVPFGVKKPEPERAVIAALVAPALHIVVGFILLFLAGQLAGNAGFAGGLKAFVQPVGMINVGLGLINLIPGLPFDGGWALMSIMAWFSGDYETGTRLARGLGQLAALVLVLVGAWVGLSSDQWLAALALVLAGWSAREAGNVGLQRTIVYDALQQLAAYNFMDRTRPIDEVHTADTVADMVESHPRYHPDLPLPVVDPQGGLAGVVTIADADKLLQGTWPVTPVTAMMVQAGDLNALAPDSPLPDLLNRVEYRDGALVNERHIPIVQDGRLVGSVDPARLEPFEQVEQTFGIDETPSSGRSGFFGLLAVFLPAIIIVVTAIILGNIAIHINPEDLTRPGATATPEVAIAPVTFGALLPAEGSTIGLGATTISAELLSAAPVTTATIEIDGQPVSSTLSEQVDGKQSVTAQVGGFTQGSHSVIVTAATPAGQQSRQWQFMVIAGAAPETPVP